MRDLLVFTLCIKGVFALIGLPLLFPGIASVLVGVFCGLGYFAMALHYAKGS
jgi:hypothetical protein